MPWQLCLSWANDALIALPHPALTQIRVSIDNEPLHFPNRWRIGLSSLLFGAVAVRPFVDVVLTSSPQPGLEVSYAWDINASASYPELSLIMAALSAGPVGIGDAIGLTNVSLTLAACRSDGVLLRPSAPAVFLDSQFRSDAFGGSVPALPGTAFQAHSFVPAAMGADAGAAFDFATVLVVDAGEPRVIVPADLSPPLPAAGGGPVALPHARALTLSRRTAPILSQPALSGEYIVLGWSAGLHALSTACADGAPAAPCLALVSAARPLSLAPGPGGGPGGGDAFAHDLEIASLAPVLASGWALVGEIAKVVRVSPDRFASVGAQARSGGPGLAFDVMLAANEAADVLVLAPAAGGGGSPLDGTLVRVRVASAAGAEGTVSVDCAADAAGAPSCRVHTWEIGHEK